MLHIRLYCLLGVIFCGCHLASAADAVPPATIAERISRYRAIAEKIVIDGKADDWKGLAEFTMPRGDAGGDDSRDIIGVAIAPREKDLLVMIRTAGRPTRVAWSFNLWLSLFGDTRGDFLVQWDYQKQILAQRVGGDGKNIELAGAEVAIDDVVELRLPYASLAPLMPVEEAKRLMGEKARSWVRVWTRSRDGSRNVIVKTGPTVASYRLVENLQLDEPQRDSTFAATRVGVPYAGRWLLGQGAFGSRSHQVVWAYDFYPTDLTANSCKPGGGRANEDYYGWGKEVRVPADCRVLSVNDDTPDNLPDAPVLGTTANQVIVETADHTGLLFGHLMHGSIKVKAGDHLHRGDVVGLLGNSMCDEPHLHVAIHQWPDSAHTSPMELVDVTVGLNPGENDPWNRTLKIWSPREGYYVEAAK